MKNDSNKDLSFIEKTAEIDKYAEFSKYLTDDESVAQSYTIGRYTVLLTNQRIIMIKKFPRNITKIEYEDIELVEYYTDVNWAKLVYSVVFGVLSLIFYLVGDFIFRKISVALPFIIPLIKTSIALDMSLLTLVLFAVFTILFFSNLYAFFDSFMGRLRVIPKKQGPKDIITKLTKDVQEIIAALETKKRELKTSSQQQ